MEICKRCKNELTCRVSSESDFCLNYEPRPLTNADRVRQMTDEELAEWLASIVECDDGCPCIKECGEKEEMGFCYPSMLEWLRKEVDNNAQDVNLSNREA